MACLVLLAFALQSYTTQTHMHPGMVQPGVSSQAPAPGTAPLNSNPFDCPLCQAVSHSGVFLHSAVVLVPLVAAGMFLAAPKPRAARSPGVAARNGQSRAPPLH